jgi:hypothetical protein
MEISLEQAVRKNQGQPAGTARQCKPQQSTSTERSALCGCRFSLMSRVDLLNLEELRVSLISRIQL